MVEAMLKLLKLCEPPDQAQGLGRGHRRELATSIDDRCDRHHEAVTPPVPSLDGVWAPSIIAEHAPQLLDAGCEGVVAHRNAAPNAVRHFLFGDKLLRPLGQQVQHGSCPRRKLRLVAVTPKLAGSRVETKRGKRKLAILGHGGQFASEFPGNFPELVQDFLVRRSPCVARGRRRRNARRIPVNAMCNALVQPCSEGERDPAQSSKIVQSTIEPAERFGSGILAKHGSELTSHLFVKDAAWRRVCAFELWQSPQPFSHLLPSLQAAQPKTGLAGR
jgi:hypothetical protein